ncbi:MAG: hypothetical protein WBQ73_02395 [Candidatus Babeliales bacterium]
MKSTEKKAIKYVVIMVVLSLSTTCLWAAMSYKQYDGELVKKKRFEKNPLFAAQRNSSPESFFMADLWCSSTVPVIVHCGMPLISRRIPFFQNKESLQTCVLKIAVASTIDVGCKNLFYMNYDSFDPSVICVIATWLAGMMKYTALEVIEGALARLYTSWNEEHLAYLTKNKNRAQRQYVNYNTLVKRNVESETVPGGYDQLMYREAVRKIKQKEYTGHKGDPALCAAEEHRELKKNYFDYVKRVKSKEADPKNGIAEIIGKGLWATISLFATSCSTEFFSAIGDTKSNMTGVTK